MKNVDVNGYPIFTKEMKKDYLILIPNMLDLHMILIEKAFISCGYKCKVLTNMDGVAEIGLKYLHNDTCYPATLMIGQFIDALNHMEDTHHIALLITQTGGGCRASNYIHLLRKALVRAGYDYVPVISLSIQKIENSGFEINLDMMKKLAASILYGDLLMYLYNKTRSYEVIPGSSRALAYSLIDELSVVIAKGKGISKKELKKNFTHIIEEYEKLEIRNEQKVKVGVVGEIYVKFSALGNNHLEDFLISQDVEINVPGLMGFMGYFLYLKQVDHELYGGKKSKDLLFKFLFEFTAKRQLIMVNLLKNSKFGSFAPFKETLTKSEGILSHGVKMGEGFLLAAEMAELIEDGFSNIVCVQPFGCLPNHICGKGVMKNIKEKYPDSNIAAIDYDAGATKVNQENRIKLMLAVAKENLNKDNRK